jgi:bifunctional DNA-binding transcriptional regulator/antitoxin component of YhaV-PrlF toxin-antitoxin module
MKLNDYGKVGPHGEVVIPTDYRKIYGLNPGEEIEFKPLGEGLLIERVKEAVAYKENDRPDPVKALTGSLEIDPKLADAILEADYQPEDA